MSSSEPRNLSFFTGSTPEGHADLAAAQAAYAIEADRLATLARRFAEVIVNAGGCIHVHLSSNQRKAQRKTVAAGRRADRSRRARRG